MNWTYSIFSYHCALFATFLVYLQIQRCTSVYHEEPKYKCPERAQLIYPCYCEKGSDDGISVRCENVNLATLSVALQNLGALSPLIFELTIYKGKIARLYGPLFAKINARKLIFNEVALESIEEHTFHGLNKTLEELHIINSKIERFPAEAVGILSKLTVLNIHGHNIETLNKDIFVGREIANRLETLRLTNGTLKDLPVESFQLLRKLKTLDLHGNRLTVLKRNQFKNLRDVENLDISFNNITKLEAINIADLTKLGWCNVSNNAIADLPRGTFARNSVLKVLNLSFNMIQRLDANSFRGMRFLRRLYLNDNQLSDIGRGTFGSITRIGTIDIARNLMKKIEFQMFSQLNYVEILDMAENNITVIEKHSFKDIYQCKINISHNAIEKIEPLAFENCINITVLDLSHNKLTEFVKGSFDETTFPTEFQISHNFFTDLSQIPLQNMSGLKILNASFNSIETIPKNTFPKLYELHTIDVSHNNISTIANGVFQMLFSLRNLNISHNSLEEIKTSMFGTMPTVLELDLSYNKLTSIVRGALAKLTSLRQLYLQNNLLEKLFQIPISLNELYMANNKLQSIPPGTWPVMNSLLYLDLAGNNLSDSLEGDNFKGLLVLQTLVLNKNNISYPPKQSLTDMSTLQYLHLEENNITKLEKSAFGKLPVLFHLNLYNNSITEVSKRSFDGLLQLLLLNLSSNALDTIPTETFLGLPSLRTLDLSNNNLKKLDNKTNGVLDDLISLEKLNLSHNKISFVTKKSFPSNKYIPYNLRELDLSYNSMPVLTYDITFGTKKLYKLDLSHNHINEIRKGVLGNMTNLRTLDLSYNSLRDLVSGEIFINLPDNLTTINVRNNEIYKMPFDKMLAQLKLTNLDLRENQLEKIPVSLLMAIKNGTEVLFNGNPLYCNCAVRPFKHYLLSQTNVSEEYANIMCSMPAHLSNQPLISIADENLQCSSEDNKIYQEQIFDILPDVRFREVNVKDDQVIVKWYVTSTRDIAEFSVYIRNKKNEIFYQKEFDYEQRSARIAVENIEKATKNGNTAEICVISKESSGTIGRWFESQCVKTPDISKKSFRGSLWARSSSSSNRSLGLLFNIALLVIINYSTY
ncbi:chaoptin [Eupeodes corollae]|uniref:chaoptin n=1 Tax=Eupeodes corollae TaxID=290404 RepID=UPI00248F83EF|nr:chaoptin [Eupeodes corollae]